MMQAFKNDTHTSSSNLIPWKEEDAAERTWRNDKQDSNHMTNGTGRVEHFIMELSWG